ncbi:Ribonuclease E [uncultured Roseburia sp.]|uniref:Ribonuclease E/G n=1 Tax=Brotonthovivens ammoniilytica TaxID=2981725 RepID=A0ABT2TGE0_9FIRM|nr:ribonuclease E/G [Brotonthovivens ammoniilytica]MCU6761255.1 ribonuclease E/G [Brotonthovivens ammoniilytica]SCI23422.1 Ribonuclease E [uncultured Roseburia sp.]
MKDIETKTLNMNKSEIKQPELTGSKNQENNRHLKLVITRFSFGGQDTPFILTGLFRDCQLMEVNCQRSCQESVLGNIYVGRVQKIVKNLNAAFIEYEKGKNGYYSLEDCKDPIYIKKINSPNMVQGDEVLVQVAKENLKTKLPVLTTNINLAGTCCVLTSGNKKLGISSKINKKRREELQELFSDLSLESFGLILRTNAKDAETSEILKEYQLLKRQFDNLLKDAKYRTCFSCLKRSEPGYLKALKNNYVSSLEAVITDQPDIFEEIEDTVSEILKSRQVPLTLYQDKQFPLAALFNIEKQMERAVQKKVWLKSGGYLVIEPTEALTVIDVNTGKSMMKKNPQEHFLDLNKEAALEIAFQLRLRNISGIVIIDFIDLKSKEDQKELLQTLTQAVRQDPVPVQVVDMTRLNLVELTRKKVSKSLKEQLT